MQNNAANDDDRFLRYLPNIKVTMKLNAADLSYGEPDGSASFMPQSHKLSGIKSLSGLITVDDKENDVISTKFSVNDRTSERQFSMKGFKSNQILTDLRVIDPNLHDYVLESLRYEKRELLEQLDAAKSSPPETRLGLKCQLWVTEGALDHDLDCDLLTEIAAKYKKLGMVPNGYLLPELFEPKKN